MDFFNSFFQNVKDKLTSPFFGTLTFIIIFHHWEFWYTLFNFDKDCTRTEKLAILRLLASEHFSTRNLISDAVFAIIFVIVGYAVIFCTRALSLAFDHKLMTWLTGKVVSKNVVLLDAHKAVVIERDKYAEQYEEQRQRVRNFSTNLDEQTKQIQEKDALILEEGAKINALNVSNSELVNQLSEATNNYTLLKTSSDDLNRNYTDVKEQLLKYEESINRLEKSIFLYRQIVLSDWAMGIWTSSEMFPPFITKKVIELKEKGLWKAFITVYAALTNRGEYTSKQYESLVELELVSNNGDRSLTELGMIIGKHRAIFRKLIFPTE